MRRLLCLLICFAILTLTGCADSSAKKEVNKVNNVTETFEAALTKGDWISPYKETYDYKPLYENKSPYKAEGENLIRGSGFDGVTVGNIVGAENSWAVNGVWGSAYTVTSGVGVDNGNALRFQQLEQGKSNTVANYYLKLESNTSYVLNAKLKTSNLSTPVIKVAEGLNGKLLAQVAGGYDDSWDEVSVAFKTEEEAYVTIIFNGNATGDNYTECVSGTSYLDDLGIYKTVSTDVVKQNYRLNDYDDFGSWDGSTPSGWKWGMAEFWWYSNAKVFSYNAVAEVDSPDSSYFRLKGRPKVGKVGYFGVEFTWETKLEAKHGYKFSIHMPAMGENPDFITVNDNIVWTLTSDGVGNSLDSNAITFEYIPKEDEYARIRLICETGIERGNSKECSRRMLLPPNGNWGQVNISCERTVLLKTIDYTKYDLHKDTEFQNAGEGSASKMLKSGITAESNEKIESLVKCDYETADTTIYEMELNIMYEGSAEIVKALNMDTLAYIPQNKRGDTNFEEWAKRAKDAGITHLFLYTVTQSEKDNYVFTQLISMLEKSEKYLKEGLNTTMSLANRWLELVPNGNVTVCFCEMESWFGSWTKGIENTVLSNVKGYENIKQGGLQAYETVEKYLSNVKKDCVNQLNKPEKVKFLYNSSRAGLDATYLVKSGADLIYNKGTNRANYNITTAVARGAGTSFELPFGVGWDTFDRDYWYGVSNQAVVTGFLSLFHSGVTGIFNEINVHTNDGKISTQGKAWLDGVRYAKTHPSVGKPEVDIAVMRGEGDDWFRITGKSSGWEQGLAVYNAEMDRAIAKDDVPTKWAAAANARKSGKDVMYYDTYLGDYSLLDVIFSDYGVAQQTDLERLYTGTPYGPADIISDTIDSEKLSNYKTLIYCGRGQGISKETAQKLEEYVKNGGKLVIAAGQLKDDSGELVTDTFASVKLGKQKIIDMLPYTYLEADNTSSVKLIKRHKNDDPQGIYAEYGEGAVALFSGEYLSSFDTEIVREVMKSFLSENAAVKLSKQSEYIEFTPNRKGNSIIIPFINQGRGQYPSGNGKDLGVFRGTASVDLSAFGIGSEDIQVYRVNQSVDGTKEITLSPIEFKQQGNKVTFGINVSIIDEIVIGPKESAKNDFFGK